LREDEVSGRFGELSLLNGISGFQGSSGMGAPGAAGFGAGPESFIHDFADGARATAALCAAPEAAIDLSRRPGRLLCIGDDAAHVVVAQHIAGTDDHQHQHLAVREASFDMSSSLTGCKSKTACFKLFQTGRAGSFSLSREASFLQKPGFSDQQSWTSVTAKPHISKT